MQIQQFVVIQPDGFPCQRTAHPFQFITAVKRIDLQKLVDIVFKDLDDGYIHGFQVDGFERKNQLGTIGNDDTLAQNPHRWQHISKRELGLELLRHFIAHDVLNPGFNPKHLGPDDVALRIDTNLIPVDGEPEFILAHVVQVD